MANLKGMGGYFERDERLIRDGWVANLRWMGGLT